MSTAAAPSSSGTVAPTGRVGDGDVGEIQGLFQLIDRLERLGLCAQRQEHQLLDVAAAAYDHTLDTCLGTPLRTRSAQNAPTLEGCCVAP